MADAGDQVREKRPVFLLLSASVLGIILLTLLLMPGGESKPDGMRKRIADLTSEARSRREPRTVLRGQPVPGNAWGEYSAALESTEGNANMDVHSLLRKFVDRDTAADRTKVEKLVADHAGVFGNLRRGAQRAEGQYPYEWEKGVSTRSPSVLASRIIALLAASQARIWTENGRAPDAANLLLDLSMFARDLGSNGTLLSHLIGIAVYSIALDEARHLILSGKLSRQDLAGFSKQLETLDHDFPRLGPVLVNEVIFDAGFVGEYWDADPSPRETWNQIRMSGWSYGFSARRMAADALMKNEGYMRRAQSFDKLSFAELGREAASIDAEVASSRNSLTRQSMPSFLKMAIAHRDALAHLRLLRVGATFLATGEVLELADPFGDVLLHTMDGGKLKIWSLGKDGTNQDGVGDWHVGVGAGAEDILLEIR